jgi:hypothetical protein
MKHTLSVPARRGSIAAGVTGLFSCVVFVSESISCILRASYSSFPIICKQGLEG